ncbi:aspartate:alanine exchanger family transporter [Corallincola platygyrae]|uniref:Aspartate:alanine exchanger family transporter n=1 Tax=Corallincola platygyrae TaxID=1193278 RepID=A0ABW4XLS1_9GAMM
MIEEFMTFMQNQPVLVFFLVLSLGYAVGRIPLGGITLGPAGGVLLAGLFFGHLGFTMYSAIQTMGFAIFIFCVGYQAGPKFFDVLMTDGLKYLSLALVIAATGFGLSAFLAGLLDFQPGMAAGMLGGALTTTPTLAAAQDAVSSGIAPVPEGFTEQQVLTNIGAGYALTYLFGLIGLILSIRLLPKFLGINLAKEAAKLTGGSDEEQGVNLGKITRRTYRITKTEGLDRNVGDIEMSAPGKIKVVAIRRNGEVIPVLRDTLFQVGDEVLVLGDVKFLLVETNAVAEEISDDEGLSVAMSTVKVVVSNKEVVGVKAKDLRPEQHVGAIPLSLHRHRQSLPLSGDLELRLGDVIDFYGPEEAFDRLAEHVGHVEREIEDTDLLTFGLGIAAGIMLGTLAITIAGVTIGLGMAGGLLIVGLLIGFVRSIWPVFGRVPSASRWVLSELGLMMFMAGVGLNAGGGIVDIVQTAGIKLIGAGIIVTLIPVFIGYTFSRKVLNLNPAEAFGGVTGAMTSGAALSVVCEASKSSVPALGYTGAYAFANVILTLAGTLMMLM